MKFNRILSIVMSLCMMISVAQFPVSADTVSVVVPAKLTFAGGVQTGSNGSNKADNAVDGDYSTYYVSDLYKGSQGDLAIDLIFELDTPGTLDSLKIQWGNKGWGNMGVNKYNVAVSEDNVTYTTIREYDGLYNKPTTYKDTYGDDITYSGTSGAGSFKAIVEAKGLNLENVKYIKIEIRNSKFRPTIAEIEASVFREVTLTSYTVNYVDTEGNPIADAKVVDTNTFVGDPATETAPAIPGYEVIEATKTITLVDGENVIRFEYEKLPDFNYTVKYVDEEGNPLVPETTGVAIHPYEVTIETPYVNGYYKPATITKTIASDGEVIEFVYEALPERMISTADDLLVNATATASGQYENLSNGKSKPEHILDNDDTTFVNSMWSSKTTNFVLTIDLHNEYDISDMSLLWCGGSKSANWFNGTNGGLRATKYTVAVSTDGTDYRTVYTYDDSERTDSRDIITSADFSESPRDVRYVKITALETFTGGGRVVLFEVDVNGHLITDRVVQTPVIYCGDGALTELELPIKIMTLDPISPESYLSLENWVIENGTIESVTVTDVSNPASSFYTWDVNVKAKADSTIENMVLELDLPDSYTIHDKITIRKEEHTFDNDCDTTCSECVHVREVGDHVFDNGCDTACNICNITRSVPPHVYDDEYDIVCNECGKGLVSTLKESSMPIDILDQLFDQVHPLDLPTYSEQEWKLYIEILKARGLTEYSAQLEIDRLKNTIAELQEAASDPNWVAPNYPDIVKIVNGYYRWTNSSETDPDGNRIKVRVGTDVNDTSHYQQILRVSSYAWNLLKGLDVEGFSFKTKIENAPTAVRPDEFVADDIWLTFRNGIDYDPKVNWDSGTFNVRTQFIATTDVYNTTDETFLKKGYDAVRRVLKDDTISPIMFRLSWYNYMSNPFSGGEFTVKLPERWVYEYGNNAVSVYRIDGYSYSKDNDPTLTPIKQHFPVDVETREVKISIKGDQNLYESYVIVNTNKPVSEIDPTLANFAYMIENGEATIYYVGEGEEEIEIPATVDGYPVTKIGNYAFSDCKTLTSIAIPDSVISIGNYAFYNCSSLTSITIGDSVTTIGDGAFPSHVNFEFNEYDNAYYLGNKTNPYVVLVKAKDTSITSCQINTNTKIIYDSAFGWCESLTNITIPDSVTSISDSAFAYCESLTSVTIPDGVTTIGDFAFDNCRSLTSIVIPEGVTEIGYSAFARCSSLASVTIPEGVTLIGDYAFVRCYSLTELNVNANNQNYSSQDGVLFNKDKTILIKYPIGKKETAYTIPDSVTTIGREAFSWCTSLTSVTIPDGVTTIGDFAFDNCRSLTSIVIPEGVTEIGYSAFSWCTSLTSITVDEGNEYYSSQDGVLLNKKKTTLIRYPEGKTETTYTIPDSVTTIDDFAFSDCHNLTSVTIPDGVTTIGDYAFARCTSLTSITIPDAVTSIGSEAFAGCDSLTELNVNANNQNYSSADGVLFNKDKTILIQYPIGKKETAYTIPDSVTTIGYSAFAYCESLTSVTIPEGVTLIGDHAFYDCTSLTDVYYNGTKAQKDNIVDDGNNEYLFNATWHYAFCTDGSNHKYSDSCDTDCNECGETRETDHTYDNACDSTCNECGECRVAPIGITTSKVEAGAEFTADKAIDKITSTLFKTSESFGSGDGVKTIVDIVFDFGKPVNLTEMYTQWGTCRLTNGVVYGANSADATEWTPLCTIESPTYTTKDYGSGFTQAISHEGYYRYIKLSVTKIAVGGRIALYEASFKGDIDNHVYDNACDPDCNECGDTRKVPDHVYDNDCDADCNSCGELRDREGHKYDNACDTDCNSCGETRETEHVYDNTCDTDCNECGDVREITHTYIHACDPDCNVCGYTRTVSNHVFDNRCDADCNICGALQEVGDHIYTDDMDVRCNECGHTRVVENAPTFVVENKTAKVGNTFTVAVSTKNNIGIVSLKLRVGYDADVLELVNIEEADFVDTSFGAITKNPITVLWEDVLNPDNTTNGTVALLTFKVKDTAVAGTTEITVTYDPEDVYDYYWNNVEFATQNGTVTVVEYYSGDVNADGEINNKDLGILRRYLNEWEVEIDELASDVNRDGKVNNKDLGILRRYLNDWDVELK